MNYEEKYNAALERASKLKVQNPFDTVGQMVEHIFPELKENENEKIRKDILCYFEHYAHDIKGADAQKWIAWLKEQKTEEIKEVVFSPAIGCDIDSAARQAIKKQRVSGKDIVLAFNGVYIRVEEKTADDIVNEYYSWIKKQGEQTHDELNQSEVTSDQELEQKFHPGDWVIDNFGNTYQIETATEIIAEHIFGYTIVGGGYFNDNSDVRLWTIADAKDGDILVDKYNNIGIYKEIGAIYWDSYIYLGCNGVIRGFSIGGRHEQTGTHPATKEQCDLFFAKMKEAGWERIVKIKN